MNIKIVRNTLTELSSIGDYSINGFQLCNTLEPKDRELLQTMSLEDIKKIKVPGLTAIPYGIYEVTVYYSPDHKMYVPLLVNVPGFNFVEQHIGNYPKDTLACQLLGVKDPRTPDFVGNSIRTFNKVFPIIKEAFDNKDKITLEITK